jgi:hypothetical protein
MRTGRPISDRIKVGEVYESKACGFFKILEVNNAKDILCEFVKTGYQIRKQAVHVFQGSVKDPLHPVILGVGFFGVGNFNTVDNREAHQKWRNMLTRCYDDKYQSKNPTYKGCSVCPEWHNFQNFAEWYERERPDDGNEYHLDKDKLVHGNKIYGPDFCSILTPLENVEVAHAKHATLISPDGEVVKIFNRSKFARENGLSQAHLNSVINGERNQHKGWKRA